MHDTLPYILFWVFWAIWLALAIRPLDRPTWWLENIVPAMTLPVVLWAFRHDLLSRPSMVAIFVFGVMHAAATHYSYAKTPWGTWFKKTFGLKRNPYDRLVHFLYGLLTVPVVADIFQHYLPAQGFVRGLFIFSLITACGALYEIAEYGSAVVLGKGKGLSFLGVQGDIWDAQKDMLMQAIGAVVAIFLMTRM